MEDIARQMMCTNRSICRFMDRILESFHLSTSQGRILIYIATKNAQITAQDISNEFNMKRSTVSEHVQSLEKWGYVCRADASVDKRKKWITISENGSELVKEMKKKFEENEKYLNDLLNEEEQKMLFAILKKIRFKLKEDFHV